MCLTDFAREPRGFDALGGSIKNEPLGCCKCGIRPELVLNIRQPVADGDALQVDLCFIAGILICAQELGRSRRNVVPADQRPADYPEPKNRRLWSHDTTSGANSGKLQRSDGEE